jgi:tripartite-type tricarboxylate transporter receptor subunit TctC
MNILKKIFLSLLLITSCNIALSETVEVVWPFSVASPTTNYVRTIIDQANQSQNNYNFILIHKPGAGGLLAANYVKNNNKLSLLISSNAFFIRPYLYPSQSYEFNEFKPVTVVASMPVAFIGKSNSNWSSLTQQQKISIGITGLGSFAHVLAQQLLESYPQTLIVPYQGPTEACKDVAGGIIDLCIDVPSAVVASLELYKIHFITGDNDFNGKFTLASTALNKVFSQFNLEFGVFAKADIDNKTLNELITILNKAKNDNAKLKELYQQDLVNNVNTPKESWYNKNIIQWKSLTNNIKLN